MCIQLKVTLRRLYSLEEKETLLEPLFIHNTYHIVLERNHAPNQL